MFFPKQMCHQEFIKRQKPYWDVINALDRGDSPGADRSGDEFGSDDSWLIQAISQEEQASISKPHYIKCSLYL